MKILLISDLHLSAAAPDRAEMLRNFLRSDIVAVDALYILGDLFDFWIGDDGIDMLGHREIATEFRALADRGIAVYFMHGNRDFMIGSEFTQLIGAELLCPISTIDHRHTNLLVCHGDHLCTDDVDHQKFRTQVLDADWQHQMLQQPIAVRLEYAKSVRAYSAASKTGKAESIMDVNQAAVRNLFEQHGTGIVIHGHTHRPAIHEYQIGSDHCLRVVLGDWVSTASYLSVDDSNMRLVSGSGRENFEAHWDGSRWRLAGGTTADGSL